MNQRESESARELLLRSLALREDLIGAVGKLDAYIEQLKAATADTEERDGASRN